MANHSFFNSHYLEIFKTALPYMNPQAQKSVEILVKADELMDAVRIFDNTSELSAASIRREHAEPEIVLNQIRSLCTKEEQVMIDNLLNVITMQKLIQNYRNFLTLQNSMEKSASHINSSPNERLMEFLLAQLTPEQKNNFDSINMVLNTMNH